jgi:hypothetical protein
MDVWDDKSSNDAYYVRLNKLAAQFMDNGRAVDPAVIEMWAPGFNDWLEGYVEGNEDVLARAEFPGPVLEVLRGELVMRGWLVSRTKAYDTRKPSLHSLHSR